jgi:hypothetical protein
MIRTDGTEHVRHTRPIAEIFATGAKGQIPTNPQSGLTQIFRTDKDIPQECHDSIELKSVAEYVSEWSD